MKKLLEGFDPKSIPNDGVATPELVAAFRAFAEADGYVCFSDWGRLTPEEAADWFAASLHAESAVAWMERICGPREAEKVLVRELRRIRVKTRQGHRPKKVPTEIDLMLAILSEVSRSISARKLGAAVYSAPALGRKFGNSAASIAKKIEIYRKNTGDNPNYIIDMIKAASLGRQTPFPLRERDWEWIAPIVAAALEPDPCEK